MDRPEHLGGCDGPKSHCVVALLHGPPLTLFHPALVETTVDGAVGRPASQCRVELSLDPGRLIVIGRARGYEVPYLDTAYQATPLVPETGQSILSSDGRRDDNYVSRAHFTLRAAGGGIVLVNGVPKRGGGIRPPTNTTYLVEPVRRVLGPGEELMIESGGAITIQLPNRCIVRLAAR